MRLARRRVVRVPLQLQHEYRRQLGGRALRRSPAAPPAAPRSCRGSSRCAARHRPRAPPTAGPDAPGPGRAAAERARESRIASGRRRHRRRGLPEDEVGDGERPPASPPAKSAAPAFVLLVNVGAPLAQRERGATRRVWRVRHQLDRLAAGRRRRRARPRMHRRRRAARRASASARAAAAARDRRVAQLAHRAPPMAAQRLERTPRRPSRHRAPLVCLPPPGPRRVARGRRRSRASRHMAGARRAASRRPRRPLDA